MGRAPDGRPSSAWRRLVANPADTAATVALTVLTLVSAAGLFRVFAGRSWIAPVAVTMLATHAVLWALRKVRVPSAVALPWVILAVILLVVWTVAGSSLDYGIPAGRTFSEIGSALGSLNRQFASLVAPVPPTTGFELLAATGGGVVAVLADWVAFRWRQPLAAVLPGLATFVLCAADGRGGGRSAYLAAEVAAAAMFVLVAEDARRRRSVWFAGVRRGALRWSAVVGTVAVAAAVVAATALSPSIPARDGSGPLGWRSGGGGGTRQVPDPLVSLQRRLIHESNVPVFEVSSTVPSYWRLTSLDSFNGTAWSATGQYSGFDTKLPGVPANRSVRTVRATFRIQQLDSPWLPDQFYPVAVRGVRHVSYNPASNSLLTSGSTSNRLTYSVTSYQILGTLSARALNAAPPVSEDTHVSRDLQLPPLDPAIGTLAEEITANATTEYQKAMAIQDYLRGPWFSYSLSVPANASANALDDFLFTTHQGYCQQFAGAFAVLAREAGLPTRLAIGFVTGQQIRGGYEVEDKDAHTWPEVYFGPRLGWVPFEPTPSFGIPGASRYDTSSAAPGITGPGSVSGDISTPATVGPSSTSSSSTGQHHATSPSSVAKAAAAPAATLRPSWLSRYWWLVLAGAFGAIVVWSAAVAALRRISSSRRRRAAARAGPARVILEEWAGTCRLLRWRGLAPDPGETDSEFACRAGTALDGPQVAQPAGGDAQWQPGTPASKGARLAELARLAARATYAPGLPHGSHDRARELATSLAADLQRGTPTWRRLLQAVMPHPLTRERVAAAFNPAPPVRDGASAAHQIGGEITASGASGPQRRERAATGGR